MEVQGLIADYFKQARMMPGYRQRQPAVGLQRVVCC